MKDYLEEDPEDQLSMEASAADRICLMGREKSVASVVTVAFEQKRQVLVEEC